MTTDLMALYNASIEYLPHLVPLFDEAPETQNLFVAYAFSGIGLNSIYMMFDW
jgi:glycine/D-amino acid oxidase-like deaminating enzyme